MMEVNIHEVKKHLSEYLERVRNGEVIVICKRNRPIAELRQVTAKDNNPRPVGLAKGELVVPPEFFEPLPAELVESFYGPDSE